MDPPDYTMDPHKDSPLDQWARKHLSVASAISVDLLDPFPPPLPSKTMRELPPIPDEFDFSAPRPATTPPTGTPGTSSKPHKPPDLAAVSTSALVATPVARQPPMPFDFNSISDHLKMAIYQIEAGTDQWARVHIEHAAEAGSDIGLLLRLVAIKSGWWVGHLGTRAEAHESIEELATHISGLELRSLAGDPAPRLAHALEKALDPHNSSQSSLASGHPCGHLTAALLAPEELPKVPPTRTTPFARTHSRSNSSKSLNSSHMFPYPWRHSRNNSQASLR